MPPRGIEVRERRQHVVRQAQRAQDAKEFQLGGARVRVAEGDAVSSRTDMMEARYLEDQRGKHLTTARDAFNSALELYQRSQVSAGTRQRKMTRRKSERCPSCCSTIAS